MNSLPDDLDGYVQTMSRLLDLPLEQVNQDEVSKNLALAFSLAALFMNFEMSDDSEPASIFTAIEEQP